MMFKKELTSKLPMNLQFFAEKDESNDDNSSAAENKDMGEESSGSKDSNNNDEFNADDELLKTFTQAEVNAMMAKEKKEGRRALLKQLGFKNETDAKKAIELYKALTDSQLTEDEKKLKDAEGLTDAKIEAEKRAEEAENKLSCVIAGVKKDSIDDVLAIAKGKVTDEKDIGKVLSEMKKDARYSVFFGNDDEEGTGNNPGHNSSSKDDKKGELGKRLAKKNEDGKKKSYFD